MRNLLREFIKQKLFEDLAPRRSHDVDPDIFSDFQSMSGQEKPSDETFVGVGKEEKLNLARHVVRFLSQYVFEPDPKTAKEQEKTIWYKIVDMGPNEINALKSYIKSRDLSSIKKLFGIKSQ